MAANVTTTNVHISTVPMSTHSKHVGMSMYYVCITYLLKAITKTRTILECHTV